jgi:phosphoglycerate dehydrogenase-like enzyme
MTERPRAQLDRLALVGFDDVPAGLREALERRARQVETTLDEASDALLVALGTPVDEALLARAPRLRYVGVYGTDHARVDVAAARAHGITVTNVPGYSTDSVAELALALLTEHMRGLGRARAQARTRDFDAAEGGTIVRGKAFGVIGLGRIGRRTAELARQGYRAEVAYFSRTRRPELEHELGLAFRTLPELLASCELIAIHLPLTTSTRGLLDRERIDRIRPGALVVNLSPMELFDLRALDDRLARGDLTLFFDHADELGEAELTRLTRHAGAVPYPAIGCTTVEAERERRRIALANLDAFLDGRPENRVDAP